MTNSTKLVTVINKTPEHAYFEKGSTKGYAIDGIESPELKLIPLWTYRFNQSDIRKKGHQIKFFTDENKSSVFTNGVIQVGNAGETGSYTEIKVPNTLSKTIFYQCINHPHTVRHLNPVALQVHIGQFLTPNSLIEVSGQGEVINIDTEQ